MKQNRGFSLIELIVVISVTAVLAFAVVSGAGILGGYQVRQCADSIDGALNETLVNAMSKKASVLTLSCSADGSYYMEVTGLQKQKIASDRIRIYYRRSGSAEKMELVSGETLMLSYARSSGAFLPIIERIGTSGEYEYLTVGSGSYAYCTEINVEMGNRRKAVIRLVTDTGKHYIE